MSTEHHLRLERRTAIRIAPKGSVIITAAAWIHHARVANLSTGGMLVTATDRIVTLAESVAIDLRLDGARGQWLHLAGRITRVERGAFAIAFVDPPHELDEEIAALAGDAHVHDRRVSVVLIDATTTRRQALAEAFRVAGCLVIDVETPLAAIAELGGADFEPDLIAVADSAPDETAEELRDFVRNQHPEVKLVRIGDDIIEPVGLAHWLSTANPRDDLVARIRRLLGSHR